MVQSRFFGKFQIAQVIFINNERIQVLLEQIIESAPACKVEKICG